MAVPEELLYSADHQWVRTEGPLVRVGLTTYAQEALGEVTMVRVATPGTEIDAGDELGEVEAFKAMTDLYMPVPGTVVSHNEALTDQPDAVNSDPYGEGWLCVIRPSKAVSGSTLLDAHAYRQLIGEELADG